MMIDINVPSAGGEYMDSVVVLEWLAAAGDSVEKGKVLAIVETAKASIEIEAPESGTLVELMAEPGQEVSVGDVLARLDTASPKAGNTRITASPAARRYAREHGLSLDAVKPSSPTGRIKLKDLGSHVAAAPAVTSAAPSVPAQDSLPQHADGAQTPSSGHTRLHLERRGPAENSPDVREPLIFIHGFAGDCLGWVPLLAKLGPDTPAVLLDLPGHGQSAGTEVTRVDDLAHQVMAALARQNISAGHVVGHSLGGAVAIALASNPAFRAASLCLIAPAGLGPEVNGEVLQGIARAQSVDSLFPWLKQLTCNGQLVDRAFAEFAMEQRQSSTMRQYQRQLADTLFPDGTQARDMRYELQSISVPTRIIWGRNDAVIPWRHVLGAGGHAGLHLIPETGHLPHIECPHEVARIIRELVQSANPRSEGTP